MNTKNKIYKKISTGPIISSAVSLILLTSSASSFAANTKEKCAGVVKAGYNDCASAEHICAGMNSDDSNTTDWLWLPTGTCNKINGAHILSASNPSESEEPEKSEKTAKKS